MKPGMSSLLSLIPNPKTAGARVTFRVKRPLFSNAALTDSLGITDPTLIDSATSISGASLFRVVNDPATHHLFTQSIGTIVSTWPTWNDSSIVLATGSKPGIEGGYVWYQKPDNSINYRTFNGSTFGSEVSAGVSIAYPVTLAPVASGCYVFYYSTRWQIAYLSGGTSTTWSGGVYGTSSTTNQFDAITITDQFGNAIDYVYYQDLDAGRVIELSHRASTNTWGQPRSIIAIDAINALYGLKLYGASVINGMAVVTGRLTRTSDGDPVSMDVYLMGPEVYTLGRDMFISASQIGGKLLLIGGNQLVSSGCAGYAVATATNLFGVDTSSLKLVTSDIVNLTLTEGENRSSTLQLTMSPAIFPHAALVKGAEVILEVSYNGNYGTALTGEIDRILSTKGEGQDLSISVVSTSTKRLAGWQPDQGIYIPSQTTAVGAASDLTQFVEDDGGTIVFGSGFKTGGGTIYNDTDPGWMYSGSWGVDASQGWNPITGVYGASIHYDNSSDPNGYATFTFTGVGFIFYYTRNVDRGLHNISVDGTLVATVNANNPTRVQGSYVSSVLPSGSHTVKISHGTPVANYIDVDAIEIFTVPTNAATPGNFNQWNVMYTACNSSRGGVMRARFYNEATTDLSTRNPRFGVGLNYYRENAADAAVRLGVNYDAVGPNQLQYNGLVAVYSRNEAGGSEGVALYDWKANVMTSLATQAFTAAKNAMIWFQIYFVEGMIKVDYQVDGATTWTNLISYSYGKANAWVNQNLGHGFIVMQKQLTTSISSYEFSDTDTVIGLGSLTGFPASGSILVDQEILSYSSKTSFTNGSLAGNTYPIIFWPAVRLDGAYTGAAWIPIAGPKSSPFNAINYAQNAVIVFVGLNRSLLCTYSDPNADATRRGDLWIPTSGTYYPGWKMDIGNTAKGSWVASGIPSMYYFGADPTVFVPSDGVTDPTGYALNNYYLSHNARIAPGLNLSGRGLLGTTAIPHNNSIAYVYAPITLFCDQIEYFTQDEDVTLGDALQHVIGQTGGDVEQNDLVDQDQVGAASTWTNVQVPENSLINFIAEISVPPSLANNVAVGMAFRSPTAIPVGAHPVNGYWLNFTYNGTACFLSLYSYVSNVQTLLKQYTVASIAQSGRLKISVHVNMISVWLDHKFLFSFRDDTFTSGTYKAFTIYNPVASPTPAFHFLYSEVNDLLADITVGTRGNGMQCLDDLTRNRRVYFRSNADGSMFFWKMPISGGTLPDIVITAQHEYDDSRVTRMRLEGLQVVEVADFNGLSAVGNIFEDESSYYSNTTLDETGEAQYYLNSSRQRSEIWTLDTVFHPALQPGDLVNVPIAGEAGSPVSIGIMSTQLNLGFTGDTFDISSVVQGFAA
jgi:hypothetical protein